MPKTSNPVPRLDADDLTDVMASLEAIRMLCDEIQTEFTERYSPTEDELQDWCDTCPVPALRQMLEEESPCCQPTSPAPTWPGTLMTTP